MARTSRGSVPNAGVDAKALDNLDLDDMFAGEGDDFFGGMDGMDIDLGDMDDIANSGQAPAAPQPQPATTPAAAPEEESPKRRKTKRKVKSPHFFEDDDDDFDYEPTKKKKRTSKVGNNKKKKGADDTTKGAVRMRRGKAFDAGEEEASLVSESTGAPAISGVAAAGRFGKRGIQNNKTRKKVPPLKTEKAKTSSYIEASSSIQQEILQHAGLAQSPFCGIAPSKTLFYPFMPVLPSEPSLKNRKLYPLIDRLHTNFLAQLSGPGASTSTNPLPATESEPISRLMLEATREEKSMLTATNRSELIGNAVGVLRNTVTQSDQTKLAADLLAMCSLLKKQFDFVQQNSSNMDQWCKDNFSYADYAEVYLAPSKEADRKSVLSSFSSIMLKVKVMCSGFKEPKALLLAQLPSPPPAKPDLSLKTTKKVTTKKKVVPNMETNRPSTVLSQIRPPITYPDMIPTNRRRAVSDMVAHTAAELEARFRFQVDSRRQLMMRQQSEAQKSTVEDPVENLHTAGMWKWLEKVGYFSNLSRMEIERGMEEAFRRNSTQRSPEGRVPKEKPVANVPFVERLQSLLVAEAPDSDEDDDESMSVSSVDEACGCADLTNVSVDERALLQAHSVGLAMRLKLPISNSVPTLATAKHSPESPDDLHRVIGTMITDLGDLDTLNSRRFSFLKQSFAAQGLLTEDAKRKCEAESSLIARCQTILKRSKEKAKNGKPKTAKTDELGLPW